MVVTRSGSNAGGARGPFGGDGGRRRLRSTWPKDREVQAQDSRRDLGKRRVQQERLLQVEVDRILAKVHDSGLHSLTSKEKRILKKATQAEIRRHGQ